MLTLGFQSFELHMSVERQVFLGRIEYLDDVAAHADAGVVADDGFDLVEGIQPVGDQDDGAVCWQRDHRRQAGLNA